MINTKSCILADTNTQASLFETFVSLSDVENFYQVRTEAHIAANAFIEYSAIAQGASCSAVYHHLTVRLARDASFNAYAMAFSDGWMRSDVEVPTLGSGASVRLTGLFSASGQALCDNHTLIHHDSAHAHSEQLYRGILDDKAVGVFNGKVVVHEGAIQTAAHQNNHNIVLSDKAQMNTKPDLEIYADDVQCSHGATVGQLNAEQLFYCMARGLDAESAKALLTYAFASAIIKQLPSMSLCDYATNQFLAKTAEQESMKALIAC